MKTDFLAHIQRQLEEHYGALTKLDVRDFVRSTENFSALGEMLVEQSSAEDLNIALLFDRDILAAWQGDAAVQPQGRNLSVPLEEVSHFVYLSYNHARGRNVTALEMEMQSEIDRVLLAFHGGLNVDAAGQNEMLTELRERSYSQSRYEEARQSAALLLQKLSGGDPRAWTARDFAKLRRFFHSDLAEKLHLARSDDS